MQTFRRTLFYPILLVAALFATSVAADTITLRNGGKVVGKILGQTRTSVSIRTRDGKVQTLRKTQIRRIQYGEVGPTAAERREAERKKRAEAERLRKEQEAKERAEAEKRRKEEELRKKEEQLKQEELRKQEEERKRLEEEKRRRDAELAKERERKEALRKRVVGYRPRKPYVATQAPEPYDKGHSIYVGSSRVNWTSAFLVNSQAIFQSRTINNAILGINRFPLPIQSNEMSGRETEIAYSWKEYPGAIRHSFRIKNLETQPDSLIVVDQFTGSTVLDTTTVTSVGSFSEVPSSQEVVRRSFEWTVDWEAFRRFGNRWLQPLRVVGGVSQLFERVEGEGLSIGGHVETSTATPGSSLISSSGLTDWRYEEGAYNLQLGLAYSYTLMEKHRFEVRYQMLRGAGSAEAEHSTLSPVLISTASWPTFPKAKREGTVRRSGRTVGLGYQFHILDWISLHAGYSVQTTTYELDEIKSKDSLQRYHITFNFPALIIGGLLPEVSLPQSREDKVKRVTVAVEFRL